MNRSKDLRIYLLCCLLFFSLMVTLRNVEEGELNILSYLPMETRNKSDFNRLKLKRMHIWFWTEHITECVNETNTVPVSDLIDSHFKELLKKPITIDASDEKLINVKSYLHSLIYIIISNWFFSADTQGLFISSIYGQIPFKQNK